MTLRRGCSAIILISSMFLPGAGQANWVPRTTLCNKMTIDNCALAVRDAIAKSSSPAEAIEAWGAWAEAFEKAYRGLENAPVPPSDLDQIEEKIADKIDSYTNPTSIATDLAIKRFFPLLASALEFAEGPVAVIVMGLVSPSPLQTPASELKATNDDIGGLLLAKIFPDLASDWKSRYSATVNEAMGGVDIQKP